MVYLVNHDEPLKKPAMNNHIVSLESAALVTSVKTDHNNITEINLEGSFEEHTLDLAKLAESSGLKHVKFDFSGTRRAWIIGEGPTSIKSGYRVAYAE